MRNWSWKTAFWARVAKKMKNISFKCKIYRSKSWKKVSLGLLKKKAIGIYESIKKKAGNTYP